VQASDTGGTFEITVFSELLAAKRDILEPGQALLMEVDAQNNTQGTGNGDASDLRFIARGFEPLADVAARNAKGVRIKIYEQGLVAEIQKCLAAAEGGRGKVLLQLDLDEEEVEMELDGAWRLTEQLKTALRELGAGVEVQEY
jgi:DNA polymerase-3 subunit alpha